MKLATVTGTVTATAKDAQLTGQKLLLCTSGDGELVAVDTVGAGVGDQVLIAVGSAARMAAGTTSLPVDAAILAVVDRVEKVKKR